MTEKSSAKRARNTADPAAKRATAGPVTITDTADREAAVLAKMAAITIITLTLFLGSPPLLALDPSLDVSQYGHTAWTARNGFSVGAIFAMAQTPDGYLWLGSEFGLFRFDGVQAVPWQPPAGQQLPERPYALLVTRDGTLWIGTFAGLVSWNGDKVTRYPEIDDRFVTSLLEDREGTVWAGLMGQASDAPTGELSGDISCSLFEDREGNIWVATTGGLDRFRELPGHHAVLETRPLQRRDFVRARGLGWEHLGGRPGWPDQVEERTSHGLRHRQWTAA